MQYNKNQFNKINDKKIMKKVKKQWVVVSVASLAVLGGFAVSGTLHMTQPTSSVVAHADNTSSAGTSNASSGGTSTTSSAGTSNASSGGTSTTSSAGTSNASSGGTSTTSSAGTSNASSGGTSTTSSAGTSNASSGGTSTTSSAGTSNASSGGTSTTSSAGTSNASSGGTSNASVMKHNNDVMGLANRSNSTDSSSQLNNDQKTQSDNGAKAYWNDIHQNDINNDYKQDVKGADTNSSYYQDGYNGAAAAWKVYNDANSQNGTQNVTTYNKNNAQNGNNPNSVDPTLNSGSNSVDSSKSAVIPYDPTSQSNKGEDQKNMPKTENEQATIYDNGAAKTGSKTVNITSGSAFNQGVTQFLALQGTYDAETGRWNGKNVNDAYSPKADLGNSYDQSYRGAQDAIAKQFNSSNNLTYTSLGDTGQGIFNPTAQSTDTNYQAGFNDVVKKVQNGTSFVSNAEQIDSALTGTLSSVGTVNPPLTNTVTSKGDVKNIKFLKDIDYSSAAGVGVSNGETNVTLQYTKNGQSMTFDGQNHITDFHGISYLVTPYSSDKTSSFSFNNFNAAYGSNFYGPFKIQTGTAQVNYSNVTYVGPQLMSSSGVNANVDVYGNLNVFSVGNYTSPFQNNVITEGSNSADNVTGGVGKSVFGDNQENFEANNLRLHSGANYYGSTTGGTVLNLTGNVVLDSGSNMQLVPMRTTQGQASGGDSSNGVYLRNSLTSNGTIYVNKGANLNIIPKAGPNASGLAQGIYLSTAQNQITVDGGTLSVDLNGTPGVTNANYNAGSITVANDGNFNVTGENLGNFSGYLLNVLANLNINNRGNFNIVTDGTGNSPTLLYNYGQFNVDNPGKSVYLQIKPLTNQDGSYKQDGSGYLFTNQINAYSVSYALGYKPGSTQVNSGNDQYYYKLTVPNTNGSKIQYVPLESDGKPGSPVPSSDSAYGAKYISLNATPNANFDGHINVQNQTNGNSDLNGNLILTNLPSKQDNGGNNGHVNITIQNKIDEKTNTIGSPDSMVLVGSNGSQQNLTYVRQSDGSYNVKIPQIDKTDNNTYRIAFTYQLDSSQVPSKDGDSLSATAKYFVTGQTQTIAYKQNPNDNGLTTNSVNPTSDYKPVTLPDNGSVVNLNNSTSKAPITAESAANDGIRDGVYDAAASNTKNAEATEAYENNYADGKDGSQFKNNYVNAYNNAYDGYKQGTDDLSNGNYNVNQPNENHTGMPNDDPAKSQYKDGYNQVGKDLSSGFNNNIGSNPDTAANSNNSTNSIYNKGMNEAQGVKDTINNNYDTGKNSSPDYSAAHSSFNNGYNSQMKSPNVTANTKPSDLANNYGVQMANGMQDAQNGNTNNQPQPKDSSGNLDTNNTDYKAYQDGKNAYNGINDALTGQSQGTNNTDPNKSNDASDSYNATYKATQAGLSGDTSVQYENPSPQWSAYNAGLAAKQGALDAQAGNDKSSDSYSGNPFNGSDSFAKKAYDTAKGNFNAGAGRKDTSGADSYEGKAYNAAKNNPNNSQAYLDGQAAKAGQSDAANGQNGKNATDPQNSSYNKLNEQQKAAYDRANKSYNNGLNGSGEPTDGQNDKASYNAGNSANQAIKDAYTGKSTPSQTPSDQSSYDAAKKAAQDGMNGQPASNNDKNQMNAYNAGQAAYNGMQAAKQDGDTNHDSTDSQGHQNSAYSKGYPTNGTQAQKDAYNQAYTAYKNGKNSQNKDNAAGDADSNNNQSVINQAGKDANASQEGIDAAKAGKSLDDLKKSNNSDAAKNAYNAYKGGFNQQPNSSSVSDPNSGDAYNQGKAAQQAVQDASASGSSATPGTPANSSNWTQQQKDAYNQAYKAYKAGTSPDNAGKDANSASTNASDAQANVLAYQAGQTSAATQAGITDAASGKSDNAHNYPQSKDRDSNPQATTQLYDAYTNAKKAYNGGFNGTTTSDDNNSSREDALNNNQGDAYNQGRAAQAAVQDAQSGKYSDVNSAESSNDSSYNSSSYKPSGNDWTSNQHKVYEAAYQAYLDGKANPSGTATDNGSVDYKQNQAYQAGQNVAVVPQAIKDAINGNNNSSNYKGQTTKQNTYTDAQASFSSGFNNPSATYDPSKDGNQDAYQSGQAAYQAIVDSSSGKDKSSDSSVYNGYSQQQKDAYDLAQKDYSAGMTQKTDGSYVNTSDSSKSAAYAAGSAARDGINASENGTTDKRPSAQGLNQTSYDNAQKAFNKGLSGDQTSSDAKLNPTANQAGADYKQGITDGISGNNQMNSNSDYTNAYKASKAGNDPANASKSASDVGQGNQNVAYQAGQAAQQGLNDAQNDPTKTSNDHGYNSSTQKDAYEQAQKDYRDGLNGSKSNDPNSSAYKAGLNDQATNQGIADATSGKFTSGTTPDDYKYNNDQKSAYQKAGNDFNDGFNAGQSTNGTSDSHQSKAYQDGQAANQGIKDKQSGSEPQGDNAKNVSYQQAQNDYQAGLDGTGIGKDKDGKVTNSYPNANSDAYKQGQAAKKAIQDALDGQKTPTDGANSDVFNATKAGMNDNSYSPNNYSSQKGAYNIGSAAQKAIDNASNNGDFSENGDQQGFGSDASKINAYNQAKKNFNAGMNGNYGDGIDNQSNAYDAGQAAKKGIDNAANNTQNISKDYNGNEINAYKNAQSAYNDGLNGDSTSDSAKKNTVANQAGMDAKQGIADAIKGQSNPTSGQSDAYNKAFAAAKAGNTPGASADATGDNAGQNNAYQAGRAAQQAISDGKTGKDNSGQFDNNTPTAKQAYADSKQAYNDGLSGNSSNADNTNPSSYNAGMDAKAGIADAIAGKKSDSSKAKNAADYNNAYEAAKAGKNNSGMPASGQPGADQNQAYQAGQAADQGTTDAQTGADNSGQYSNNPSAQIAYNTAKQSFNDGLNDKTNTSSANDNPDANKAGQAARQAVIDGQTGANSSYPNDPEKTAYNNAKQAYNDGLNGKTNNSNPYANEAGKAAAQGATDGQTGANNASQYSNNPAAENAYNIAKNAYNDGLNGKDNSDNPVANETGKAARQGITDAKDGKDNSKMYPNDPEKTAYEDAKNAYNAGLNGDTDSDVAKKNTAANKAGYDNFIPFGGGGVNNTDNNSSNGNNGNNGNNQNGNNNGSNNNHNNIANNPAGKNAGIKAALNGKSYKANTKGLANKSAAYQNAFNDAYNKAKAGYAAGANGKKVNTNDASYKAGYEAGHKQFTTATKAGENAGNVRRDLPNFKHESKAYINAYKKAYEAQIKKTMPRYVYNLKKIYRHSSPVLDRKTRGTKYAKTVLYERHVFKVEGYKINDKGQVVYKVNGGWIPANGKSVADVYYRHNDQEQFSNDNKAKFVKVNKRIRVIKPKGTYTYNSKQFNKKTAVKNMRKGSVLKVKGIEKLGRITRFYLGDGRYISSNKTIVKEIR
ncbi:DUF5776 domain-containing protein [Apilactobacillus apisilvae]|uniref:DUF5776 domain-containing protein n=1 Tax=Apilactobacillus apisilvae TaxID=2923364 RepID=A0ABY4PHK2_9LACO|nr:DUF5776 domain-containing protein [Apilactobacillus apisilvae]UQS84931.1 DUF5776 domain-containing protein [Apilactobacillus apisilvae]